MALKTAGAAGSNVKGTFIRLRPLKDTEVGTCRELKIGERISGVLKNTFVSEKFGKNNFVLSQQDGTELIITDAGNLGSRMSEVAVGSYVEIEYNGKSKMTKGKWAGTPAHNFTVQYDDSIAS